MEIEKTIIEKNQVFALARRSPLFFIDGRIYYCLNRKSDINFFNKGSSVIEVREGPSLESLERILDRNLDEDYCKYQEEVIRRELRGNSIENNSGNNRDVNLARFAFAEIFPHLRKDNSVLLGRILEVDEEEDREKNMGRKIIPNERLEREIENYLAGAIQKLERADAPLRLLRTGKLDSILLKQIPSKTTIHSTAFSCAMQGYNFAFLEDKVYLLSVSNSSPEIIINNRGYNLVESVNLGDFKKKYANEKIRHLAISALKEKFKESKEFQEILRKRAGIEEVCRKDNYHEQDFGFEKKGSNLVVYVDVPDYVLQDSDNRLYKFDAHRLGIAITGSRGAVSLSEHPKALSRDKGLGVFYNYDGSGGHLCMGNYSMDYFSSMEKGKAFAKLLTDARNVVLRSYGRPGSIPHAHPSSFPARKITAAEVERLGLEITNSNPLGRGGRVRDYRW